MKKHFLYTFLFLVHAFVSCQPKTDVKKNSSQDGFIIGKVIKVSDGDTYHILVNGHQKIKVRMQGIDAPERSMPFYAVSKKYLNNLIYQKEIKVQKIAEDRYGRTLGFTYLMDGTDVNHAMLKAGLVWHFKRYSKDKILADLEKEARKNRVGLWSDPNPLAPWEFRKKEKLIFFFGFGWKLKLFFSLFKLNRPYFCHY